MLKLGVALNALGARDQACATFAELDRKYPAGRAKRPSGRRARAEARPLRVTGEAKPLSPVRMSRRSSSPIVLKREAGERADPCRLRRPGLGRAHAPCGGLRGAGPVPVTVATVDHGLRPESCRRGQAVAAWAAECWPPHRILAWKGRKPSTGLQERARAARYRLLAGLARGARRLPPSHRPYARRPGRDRADAAVARHRARRACRHAGRDALGTASSSPGRCSRSARTGSSPPAGRGAGPSSTIRRTPIRASPARRGASSCRARRRGAHAGAPGGSEPSRAQRAEDALAARAAAVLAEARLAAGKGRVDA